MGKLLGIDYGNKRIGIAITDELRMIASPLETIHSADIYNYLDQLKSREKIDALVIGLPRDLKGADTDATVAVRNFEKSLTRRYPDWEIHLVDERFTSKMAAQSLVAGGMKKSARQAKGSLDKVSAAIILQSFLDSHST